VRPDLRSRFSFALFVRISFARCSAAILCFSERWGALTGDFVTAGMGGDYTYVVVPCKARGKNFFATDPKSLRFTARI
jgi:hypothetical protein